jgi:transcriptional regulator with XRE-family HTH domain
VSTEKFTIVNFADRFSRLVEKSGEKDKVVAASIGISPGALSNYRRGRIPKSDELLRISRHFGVSMEWLLTGGAAPMTERCAKCDAAEARADRAEHQLDALRTKLRRITGDG